MMMSVTAKLLNRSETQGARSTELQSVVDRSWLRCYCVDAYMAARSSARRSPIATGRLPLVALGSFRWLQLRGHWHCLAHEIPSMSLGPPLHSLGAHTPAVMLFNASRGLSLLS